MNATVLGASGFIGSHLVAELRQRGHTVFAPERNADLHGADLGTVFFCIGLTADFRSRPFDTVEAHVSKLSDVLRHSRFDRLVYLSSTRIYGASKLGNEDQRLTFSPTDPSDLYNLSKVMGESLALHSGRPVRIARLANVYGADWTSDNFLTSLIRSAVRDRRLSLKISPRSAKDYVHLEDAIDLLIRIGTESAHSIYNIASGRNVSCGEIVDRLQAECGCAVEFAPGSPHIEFPALSIDRIRTEYGFAARDVLSDLPGLMREFLEYEGT